MKKPLDAQAKKQRRLKRTAAILALILLLLLLALAYYLLNKKSVTAVIPGVAKSAPRYVTSAYADFNTISGVAVSPNGNNVYVVDQPLARIWHFGANGKLLGTFGGPRDKVAKSALSTPTYVACAPNGDVYVTDRSALRVTVFTAAGVYKNDFGPSDPTLTWSPLAIYVAKNYDVYITDASADVHRVLVFDKNGKLKFQFGKSGSDRGDLAYPNGISISANGNIFIADSNNARVQEFDSKGKFKRILPGDFSRPIGIAATYDNTVDVVEMFGHNVQAFDAGTGAILYTYGKQGIKDGEFSYPMGIAISKSGRVFIADRQNRRLQIWQY